MPEFELDSKSPIRLSGQIRIELPDYMTQLNEQNVAELQRVPVRRRWAYMIAVGLEPKSGDIVALSADGKFYEMNAETFMLPKTKCVPVDGGQTIKFYDEKETEIAVDWFVKNARQLPLNIDMFG